MTVFDDLNHFRGSFLTKVVIDRKQKITTAHDGTAELYGPPWPEVTLFLNHINHAGYRDGLGPHLFQVTFAMVHNLTGAGEFIGDSMEIASLTIAVPATPSAATPPRATIAMGSGKQITFAFGSVAVVSRKR